MPLRSSKRSAPRKKYTVDAFEGIEDLVQNAPGHAGADRPVRAFDDVDDENGSDVDFEAIDEGNEEASDALSVSDGLAFEPSTLESPVGDVDPDSILTVNGSDIDDDAAYEDEGRRPRKKARLSARKSQPGRSKLGPKSKGGASAGQSKDLSRRTHHYGPRLSDYEPAWKAGKRWEKDLTLPSRIARNGLGGFHPSFYHTAQDLPPVDSGWDWFFESGGRLRMQQAQKTVSINKSGASQYSPDEAENKVTFVMGPHRDQRHFTCHLGEHVAVADAWQLKDRNKNSNGPKAKDSSNNGFIINLGGRVQCLDWAPCETAEYQYLATTVLPHDRIKDDLAAQSAPAFTSQPQRKSCIHIWRFTTAQSGHISVRQAPFLHQVICTEWGDVKYFKWCPVPASSDAKGQANSLGLLAGIWGDGAVRVLNVPRNPGASYYKVQKSAFESIAPDTLFTTLTWHSPSTLIAGCADGHVAIWDLAACLNASKTSSKPFVFSRVCSNYILSVETCRPSRPNMLVMTTMGGYVTLTDLRQPQSVLSTAAGTLLGPRSRQPSRYVCWHDYSQTVIAGEELKCTMRAWPLRRWSSSVWVGRLGSPSSAIAASSCHPCVLIGTTSGDVVAMNPLRRILSERKGAWQLTWFKHEWRRQGGGADERNPSNTRESNSDDHRTLLESTSPNGRLGLSRFIEGLKAEVVAFEDRSINAKDGVQFSTIHEHKTAITALSWNPNMHVGGWAAVGMADGLLRVQDIAI